MIKECPVIFNNDSVSVVKFGDTEIQFPAIGKEAKTVKVEYEDGKYSIVTEATVVKMKKRPWETKQKKQPTKNVDCIELNN